MRYEPIPDAQGDEVVFMPTNYAAKAGVTVALRRTFEMQVDSCFRPEVYPQRYSGPDVPEYGFCSPWREDPAFTMAILDDAVLLEGNRTWAVTSLGYE